MLRATAEQLNDEGFTQTLQSLESSSDGADTCRDVEGLARRLAAERPRQLRYLRSRLPTAEDAEDAWQDASIRFLQHAASLAAAERPEAWIGVSLRRLVVDRYRRAAVQRRTAEALAAEPLPQPLADPEAEVELQAPTDCLKAALGDLKPDYRDLLARTYFDETPLKAAAVEFGLTANNAAVRLHRARAALRAAMDQKCHACPLADCWAKARLRNIAA